ncbi:MAG: fused MFS/spermidine synthase [Planctomycetes bacterium]|nr:fused MFS/spermidine synthase [Planctomycetota bacterium]
MNEPLPIASDSLPRRSRRLCAAGVGLTVFCCGWVLMGLEIVGGRLLSPVFGSGIWVWGSVITVFLAALSTGYFLGGILSGRWPSGRGLAAVIFLAGVSILPIAIWYREAGEWFADLGLHERWGSLLAAIALFFIPSALLGMVSPYAVRLVTREVRTVGISAGTLYAVSTLGSCLGCLITAFYLILWLGIRSILLLSACALVVVAGWQLWIGRGARPGVEGEES